MDYQVRLFETGKSFTVDSGETVLDAALRANITLPHDCRFGGCGACRVRLLEGTVSYEDPPFGLTPEEAAAGYALACQALPGSDLVIAPEAAGDVLPEPLRHTARVCAISRLSDGVTHLRLEVDSQDALQYLPGQYMNVHLDDGSTRSFSMASKPDGRLLDFHVRRISEGKFTDSILPGLTVGDTMRIEAPLGMFRYRPRDYRPMVMVATGTGVAPIRAILQALMEAGDAPPVWLYWGVRSEEDLYLAQEVAQWAGQLDDFRFVPVLSRSGPGWQGRSGHVQAAIAEDFDDLSEHAFYICGSPQMVREAKSVLMGLGASPDHLYADSFDFAHQAHPGLPEEVAG